MLASISASFLLVKQEEECKSDYKSDRQTRKSGKSLQLQWNTETWVKLISAIRYSLYQKKDEEVAWEATL